MDALGTIKPVVSQPAPVRSAPVLPTPQANASLPSITMGRGGASLEGFDPQAAEQQRVETLMRAARSVPQPLGSQTFTMFKDGTGQYITRFRDMNTGKVTYIPEPEVFRMSAGAGAQALVNISV